MKRKLLLLNTFLVGLLILGAAELYRQTTEAAARYERLEAFSDPRQAPEFPSPADPSPTRAMDYMPIVSRLLFSEDRNAAVVVETVETEAVRRPPLPHLSGLVDFGDGPSALMRADAENPAAWVQVGGRVGDFIFEGVEGEEIKLSWNEEQFTATKEELSQAPESARSQRPPSGTREERAARRTQINQAAAADSATNLTGSGRESLLGPDLGDGRRGVVRGDNSPNGTEHEGYVKRSRSTPFGSASWWEKKEE